ncbi:MAG: UDP-N-acetylmuramoyl-L-alanine--D-glutamate ligase [Candidatus Saccharimonas sp.]
MKVVIAGYGVEGRASCAYWQAIDAEVTIADQRETLPDAPEETALILGSNAFEQLGEFDVIVRSPSIHPDRLPYGDKVWSATNEFLAKCPAPIIGVTGTKGKGTTSSLIASILRAAGKTVHLVGNIGVPALEILPRIQADEVVVYELSSFQLWDAVRSPHVAVVLGIEPDHLDVHSDLDEYVAAKANIARYQSTDDIIVFNQQNEFSQQIADLSPAQHIPYPYDISDVASSLRIPGAHNVENASAAIAAVRGYVTDLAVIRQGLQNFTGLPHRLKFVTEKDGVKYYDDSIATTPGSAIAAMRSFTEPKVLILGGSDKGVPYTAVVAVAKDTNTKVLAIGQTGQTIAELCRANGVVVEREEGLMSAVVAHARRMASSGSVVVLSPASASFDQYKSYSDRGDQFISNVEAIV